MKKVLMIAFHYPPLHGSSGIHRTLNFSRHLGEFGWQPLVLSVTPGAYPQTDPPSSSRIPAGVVVQRAPAFDAARRLSIRGRYPRLVTLPDRWVSWWPGGVALGLRMIRRQRPQLLWSTYPIATAHLIGLTLARLTGIPWVADFRDPMVEKDPRTGQEYPADPLARRVNGAVESAAIGRCAVAVFTTPGTAAMYAERYPQVPDSRRIVIANGFDEGSFAAASAGLVSKRPDGRPIVLVHSGILYQGYRDPGPFFEAIARLRDAGAISARTLQVVIRASGFDRQYAADIAAWRIGDIVTLAGSLPYDEALREMLLADGLLIFQGANCNWQIPAKAYEYLRARRPILALTDRAGDTAQLLLSEGIDTLAPIDAPEVIAKALLEFTGRIANGTAPLPDAARVERHSRRYRTRELAAVFDRAAAAPPGDSLRLAGNSG